MSAFHLVNNKNNSNMDKQNKIIIATLVGIILCSSFLNAQNVEISQTILINKRWKMIELTDKLVEDVYSETKIKTYYNGNQMFESLYYLSDIEEVVFDVSKVGKSKIGRYIICKLIEAKNDNISVLEVIKASDSEFTLRNVKHKHLLKYRTN